MGYLDELNEVQRKAATAIHGPVMVIAGPGSGKTRVLTYRISHMIKERIDPFNILALTFTNKAAREMKERIHQLAGNEAKNLWMGTFHSIFARLLRYKAEKIGYTSNFTIYDTEDSKRLLKTILKEQNFDEKKYKPNVVFNRISSLKNSLISPEDYLKHPDLVADDEAAGRPEFGLAYSLYVKRCFKAGAMDFDDLLFQTWKLISLHPDVLYEFQHRFRYILIDEYQDTNYAQYTVTNMFAAVFQNICVVGDDAQSIYSFRGANIENILNFEKDYPELQTFRLEQNYRSSKVIVRAANEIIQKNRGQIPKTIWTDNAEGEKITLFETATDNEEGRKIVDYIFESAMQYQIKYKDFCILYRTNAQSRAFEEGLRKQNIPYKIFGGLSFYQRKEVKDLLAYLKVIINPRDEESLRRIINYPTRGIGNTSLNKMSIIANDNDVPIWDVLSAVQAAGITGRTKEKVQAFRIMIEHYQGRLEKEDAYEIAKDVAKQTGLLKLLHADKTVEGVSRFENLQELLNSIQEFVDSKKEQAAESELSDEEKIDFGLSAYLQEVTLMTTMDSEEEHQDYVSLMTIHSAKGLEFQNVCVVGLEEDLFPSFMASNSREDLEEERRLFYVAVSRAERRLVLSYAGTRYRFGRLHYTEPSRFIEDLPDGIINFKKAKKVVAKTPSQPSFNKVGAQLQRHKDNQYEHSPTANFKEDDANLLQIGNEVEHRRFGFGKVLTLEGETHNKMALIEFKKAGQKKIMLRFAKLRIL